jgi:hypothetical protein
MAIILVPGTSSRSTTGTSSPSSACFTSAAVSSESRASRSISPARSAAMGRP